MREIDRVVKAETHGGRVDMAGEKWEEVGNHVSLARGSRESGEECHRRAG